VGLKTWLREQTRNQPDRTTQPRFGAGPFPFGGTDSSGAPVVSFTPQLVEAIRVLGEAQDLSEIYRTQPAVRICVNFLATNIAHLKLKSYRRTEETPEPLPHDHPLPKLLARPNPRTTGFDLIRGTVADIGIFDIAYWWLAGRGSSRALYRIPPTMIAPRGGSVISGPDHFTIHTPSGPKDLDPAEVIDFPGYNPVDTRIGLPPLRALQAMLNESVAADRYRAAFWANAAGRDGVIERPSEKEAGEWSDEDRERFRRDWQNRHTGPDNAGVVPVLEDGMKWNPDSFSPKDSEFIAGREWSLDITATVYNIPLAVLSRKSTATFASMREFRKMLYVDTLGPWNARIEQTVWLRLLPIFGDEDLYVEFNIDEKLQGDFETQAAGLRAAVHVPYMSVNDARKLRGLPRVDDEAFDVPARPINYAFGDEELDQSTEAPPRELVPAALNGDGLLDLEALSALDLAMEGR
jgi:HK97 family phage portal protein